jgi:N utilization substance protein B
MLNRRHLRVKVLQALYAYYQSGNDDVLRAEKSLFKAVEQMYDLYLFLLLTLPEIKSKAEYRLEENKKKLLPTDEDLNPNLKLINNRIIQFIEQQPALRSESENRKVNWIGDVEQDIFRKMFLQIRESETYFQFMNNGEDSFEDDKSFIIQLFKEEIANFPALFDYFEEKSIDWMDDIDLMCSMVIKTIKAFKEDGVSKILPLYKPEDDEKDFIKNLLRETIRNEKEHLKLIDELTQNWELDRIAKIDVLLMQMAIAELQVFKTIPKKVTLNEYIEIAKYYSTPKSSVFINGVLDKAIARLEKEGKIQKIGRGLLN